MNGSKMGEAASQPRRYRFGLRWLLLLVLMLSVVFAWFARENHRVRQQTQLLADLAQIEVRVRTREPTGLALATSKLLGRKNIGVPQGMNDGWYWRPRVLVTWTTTDDQVPDLVKGIKRLGVVRELHLENTPVTAQGIATLKRELPDVAVLTRVDLLNQVDQQPAEHDGFPAVFKFITTAAAGLLIVVVVLIWPLLRWRKNRRLPDRTRVVGVEPTSR